MRDISDELLYALRLPLPPAFSLRQDTDAIYKVPDFYGYESASTRWIMAILTNKTSLKRLIKSGHDFTEVFSRYYQIPDRPIDVMGSDYPLETPAYHHQSVLYLTPLALAIYMKQLPAVEMILELTNECGEKVVHPAEACFVQTAFKKGDKRMTNELSNTFPIIIAIRRSFFEGMALLVENGFMPQKQFSIIYRKVFRETVTLFRDVLDYIVDLLRKKPGLNVTKMLRTMLDPSMALTTFDVFVYDIELDSQNNWDYVSIFRRICRIGFGTKYFVEESATQVLNVLEQIQVVGYFGGFDYLNIYYNGSMPITEPQTLSKDALNELQSDKMSLIMDKIPTIIKASREDLFKLNEVELKERINYDYQCCIGILFLWFQRCLIQERCYHYGKLGYLISKVMVDTKIVDEFFEKSDLDMALIFSEWAEDYINPKTIYNFRIRMQDYILFTDHLCINFINSYGESPRSLIKAPMLRGKRPEHSPVIRDLLSIYNPNITQSVLAENDNQSNQASNQVILNVFDSKNNLSIKFIPANHSRNIILDKSADFNFEKQSRNITLNKSSLNNKCNNSNSNENLTDNDSKSNLPYPPGNCRNINIKSPTENISDHSTGVTPPIDVLYRPKIPKEFRKIEKSKKYTQKMVKYPKSKKITPLNYDGKLKKNLLKLLNSKEKYRDFNFHKRTEKVPLNFLKKEIQKYKSVDEIIKVIQRKEAIQLDCLYNNLNAQSMIEIMKKLSFHAVVSNAKSSNNEFSQVFQSKN